MAKHPELQGRKKSQIVTNLKKGSSMPAAKEGETTKTFIVADFVRMGAPDGSGAVTGGDEVQLTKPQAEWCMANGFIDSVLPDFDDPDPEPVDNSSSEAGSGTKAEGQGGKGSDGAPSKDGVQKTGTGTSGRKKGSL